jgi:ATP-binding protein involved in chromosome partitioning
MWPSIEREGFSKKMATPSTDALRASLRTIKDPASGRDIVSAGLVDGIVLRDGLVQLTLLTDRAHAAAMEPVRREAEALLSRQPGVTNATAVLTSHKGPPPTSTVDTRQGNPTPQVQGRAPGHGHAHGSAAGGKAPLLLPDVKAIIAVASGKGGVGKSTTAVNLALGLSALGLKVGILDADIYGPSLPKLLAIKERPQTIGGTRLKPISRYGLTVMSIGFLIDEETPMIWRGPMVISALTQMLREVEWGTLDIMVVDMPPGTGDAQLTMAQQVPLKGAVIVSTPQDLALIDARRGIAMFQRVNVPVLGIVENMSYFQCPQCGTRTDIFGHGGARHEAERLQVPFLGEVPLHMTIREKSDAGLPVVATEPDGPHAAIYRGIAAKVRDQLKGGSGQIAPKIVIER